MSRRCAPNEDTGLAGGFVAAFAFTIAATLIAFFVSNAGLFDPKPLARAGSPPRGDVVVFSNGEMVQVNSRLRAHPSSSAQYPNSQERLVAGWPAIHRN